MKKSHATRFVLTTICAALLAACGSSGSSNGGLAAINLPSSYNTNVQNVAQTTSTQQTTSEQSTSSSNANTSSSNNSNTTVQDNISQNKPVEQPESEFIVAGKDIRKEAMQSIFAGSDGVLGDEPRNLKDWWLEKPIGTLVYDKEGKLLSETGTNAKVDNFSQSLSKVENAPNQDLYDDWIKKGDGSALESGSMLLLHATMDKDGQVAANPQWSEIKHSKLKKMAETATGYKYAGIWGVDRKVAEGKFENIPYYMNVFTAKNVGTPEETREIATYDYGIRLNGVKQAYLVLSAWSIGDKGGVSISRSVEGGMYSTDYNDLHNSYSGVLTSYPFDNKLNANYTGYAYSAQTGKQDGVLKMNIKFDENQGNISGSITNRQRDDGRDIQLSGSVDKFSSPTLNATMAAKAGETADEKGLLQADYAKLLVSGPKAEEVGGVIKFTTHQGRSEIGFIGKR